MAAGYGQRGDTGTAGHPIPRGARGFGLAGALFLVAWQAATLAGMSRAVGVWLGLLGFVFHTTFGIWYAQLSARLGREVSIHAAPSVHLLLSGGGVLVLGLSATGYGDDLGIDPGLSAATGTVLWAAGVAVFMVAIGWPARGTIREWPTRRWTGSPPGTDPGATDNRPRWSDRAVDAVIPVALGYLAVGSYGLLAAHAGLPWVGAYVARTTHLLATGTAALLVFSFGFRMFPSAHGSGLPRGLVPVVLGAGAIGPTLLAIGLAGGPTLVAGAVVETGAVLGFVLASAVALVRSDHRGVALYGVTAGAATGLLGLVPGWRFALVGRTVPLASAHVRLALLGFLGLAVVGLSFRLFPVERVTPAGVSDRTALAVIATLAAGLLCEGLGLAVESPHATSVGRAVGLVGAIAYAGLVLARVLRPAQS